MPNAGSIRLGFLSILFAFLLPACGGGGGSDNNSPPPANWDNNNWDNMNWQ